MKRAKGRNVFDDLGFSREEAAGLQIKAELHSKIIKQAKHYKQAELQKILHETQPRVSDLLRGKIAKFSLETLIDYANALNMRPQIITHQPMDELQTSSRST
jgi:predicted XRE-type DNA-binding protein